MEKIWYRTCKKQKLCSELDENPAGFPSYTSAIFSIFSKQFFSHNNPWANVFPLKKTKNMKKPSFLASFHSLQMQQEPEEKSGHMVEKKQEQDLL